METPKVMTNALLAEHGLKQAKIAAALILKAKQVIGYSNEDIHDWLDKALQETNELIDWYASGEALQSFQQGDPDDEGEDYDTYAPEIYAMNSIDPSLLEFPPDYDSGLKEAIQKRKAALLKAQQNNNHFGEEQAADLKKEMSTGGYAGPLTKQDIEDPYFGEPKNLEEAISQDEEDTHFGEEQMADLKNLLAGVQGVM